MSRRRRRLFVAINFFAALVAFLRFDRQGGDRAGIQTLEADRLAGLLAITVGAVVDALHGGVDFGNQLALAVAGAKFNGAVCFGGSTIGKIGMVGTFFGKMTQRFTCFAQDVIFPGIPFRPELWTLSGVLKLFFFRGNIVCKINILTQRDSPEEQPVQARLYSSRDQAIQAERTSLVIFKSDIKSC